MKKNNNKGQGQRDITTSFSDHRRSLCKQRLNHVQILQELNPTFKEELLLLMNHQKCKLINKPLVQLVQLRRTTVLLRTTSSTTRRRRLQLNQEREKALFRTTSSTTRRLQLNQEREKVILLYKILAFACPCMC